MLAYLHAVGVPQGPCSAHLALPGPAGSDGDSTWYDVDATHQADGQGAFMRPTHGLDAHGA